MQSPANSPKLGPDLAAPAEYSERMKDLHDQIVLDFRRGGAVEHSAEFEQVIEETMDELGITRDEAIVASFEAFADRWQAAATAHDAARAHLRWSHPDGYAKRPEWLELDADARHDAMMCVVELKGGRPVPGLEKVRCPIERNLWKAAALVSMGSPVLTDPLPRGVVSGMSMQEILLNLQKAFAGSPGVGTVADLTPKKDETVH